MARVDFFPLPHLYCLYFNLISDPAYQREVEKLRSVLEAWMRETDDPALNAFTNRTNPQALLAYMKEQEALVQKRRLWKRTIKDGLKRKAADDPDRAHLEH